MHHCKFHHSSPNIIDHFNVTREGTVIARWQRENFLESTHNVEDRCIYKCDGVRMKMNKSCEEEDKQIVSDIKQLFIILN